MKIRFLLPVFAALLCAPLAYAQAVKPAFYLSASAGYSTASWNNVKDGYAASVAFGTVIKDRHHVEAELMYIINDFDVSYSAELQQIPVLATYLYDIPLGTDIPWSLQVGGSVGAVMQKRKVSIGSYSHSESKWGAALGAQASAVYKINERVSVNAGLKAIWTAENDLNGKAGTNTMLTVGATFRF